MDEIAIYKEKKGKKILKIYKDDDAENPREWDNFGKMACFHKNYVLGDKTELKSDNFEGWNELKEHLIKEEKAILIFPLYLYDHSGITIKIGSFEGLLPQGHAYFDSGCVGFIYCTKEDILREYQKVNKKTLKQAEKRLFDEIEIYDQYLRGDIYGYILEKEQKCKCCKREMNEEINSCWGFFGYDFKDNGLFESADININDFEKIE